MSGVHVEASLSGPGNITDLDGLSSSLILDSASTGNITNMSNFRVFRSLKEPGAGGVITTARGIRFVDLKAATTNLALESEAGTFEIGNTVTSKGGSTAGTFTLPANSSSTTVTFSKAFPSGVTPVVVCTPDYQTSFWVSSITATSFVFNVGTTSSYDQTIQFWAFAP